MSSGGGVAALRNFEGRLRERSVAVYVLSVGL